VSEVFGKIAALHTDPIEKKPLYHFFPGRVILSLGTTGCNFHCVFCQNYTLSQVDTRHTVSCKNLLPGEAAALSASTADNLGLAFTYNEPFINFEFGIQTAEAVKQNNQKTVMVSNGYFNPEPLRILLECIDAFNIDLKGFTDSFYRKNSGGTLAPVLNSLRSIALSNRHLEITHLVIPGLNDDDDTFEALCRWIRDETGKDTVLHLSRYFPRYKLSQYPTPAETLFRLFDIAREYLNFVYIGNMATEIHSNTYCPSCGKCLIERTYYHVNNSGIDELGRCRHCGTPIVKYP
ncbi:MAG TPA: AmmeMemoRadiSam system radical SAM enzyme, partial [Prolixibacteraceae bacterium]|nr:AmmeMemoRadiSam system radical SAM enzyme [Prolixibacteraceae bacterium]